MSASEDFDWTKNQRTSFYFGTFPTGQEVDYSQSKLFVISAASRGWKHFVLLQVSHGELEVLHIRLKERGTPMAKE